MPRQLLGPQDAVNICVKGHEALFCFRAFFVSERIVVRRDKRDECQSRVVGFDVAKMSRPPLPPHNLLLPRHGMPSYLEDYQIIFSQPL